MTKVSKRRRQVQHGRGQAVQKRQLRRKDALLDVQSPWALKGSQSNGAKSKDSKRKDGKHVQKKSLKVPFRKHDNVLLIGEGDFSFARCLLLHHPVKCIVATSFDSEQNLVAKYPHARHNLMALSNEVVTSSDKKFVMTLKDHKIIPVTEGGHIWRQGPGHATLHGIDATKLSTAHRKALEFHGSFDRIVFNFPHIGGLSTDVNRQTRANQELIRDFFTSAKPLLKSPELQKGPAQRDGRRTTNAAYEDELDELDEYESENRQNTRGQIIVTLFEGEAYADWNIRDIARSVGLRVVESFQFPWEAYPGYQHARTIGEIRTGKDRSSEGKRQGAWRGEERPARSFVFEMKEEHGNAQALSSHGKKDRRKVRKGSSDGESD